ncbi:glycosyltransferase family 39 protein [Clostridium sp. YIM B02505]|uniref:Glycosyltransferase family 39 protein n=1 Tax=Clostridium yunnanense TaxID=2800325 RepID=A0ABS1ELY3_9CLOT|nr:glycosyltransferase family 39 protein [Clostridium yunnanense]MBK1810391.1 glycosyltransferase family 39 protein [Clostridium yunnanense]
MKCLLKFLKENWKVVSLIVIGIVVRIIYLGIVPGGINQDEAFAGYEAYSLLRYGIDSSGYHLPVYFVSWGSGMNVLNSYLMIPFIMLFGLETWVIRLPQVLVGCASLPVFYLLLKKVFGEKTALIGLFILTISPWHIMMTRWGLESNLAPGFLLFGLYFFILGIENNKYMILSALFYGLGLYTYAAIWTVTALIIMISIVYYCYSNRPRVNRYLMISLVILIVFAIPLLLFIMVNKGLINEIKTPFISIPRMVYYRGGEVSLKNISDNMKTLYGVVGKQSDGLLWNEIDKFGLYYKFSMPLIFIGLIYLVVKIFTKIKSGMHSMEMFILIQLLAATVLGCLVSVNVNRVNSIHIPILICLTLGISFFSEKINKKIVFAIAFIYSVSFVSFFNNYVTDYNKDISVSFQRGLEDAVGFAMKFDDAQVYVTDGILYPKVLFYSKFPTDEYVKTVKYKNYPAAFLSVSSCGNLHFGINKSELNPEKVYIINNNEFKDYADRGYNIEHFENFSVAYMK